MLRKIFLGIFGAAMLFAILYMVGPKEEKQELIINYPQIPTRLAEIEQYVAQREDTVKGLKPGNEAYIIWADSTNKRKTPIPSSTFMVLEQVPWREIRFTAF
ncbi:hypothetical protein V8V91_00090 [Algoriphagus halophilus]|uniref:hypothetical protein n=1 Tax=Algoriphagus halophilus TaxID=226505 RepID=UPI00358DE9E5